MNVYAIVCGVFGPKKNRATEGFSLCGSNYSHFLVAWITSPSSLLNSNRSESPVMI